MQPTAIPASLGGGSEAIIGGVLPALEVGAASVVRGTSILPEELAVQLSRHARQFTLSLVSEIAANRHPEMQERLASTLWEVLQSGAGASLKIPPGIDQKFIRSVCNALYVGLSNVKLPPSYHAAKGSAEQEAALANWNISGAFREQLLQAIDAVKLPPSLKYPIQKAALMVIKHEISSGDAVTEICGPDVQQAIKATLVAGASPFPASREALRGLAVLAQDIRAAAPTAENAAAQLFVESCAETLGGEALAARVSASASKTRPQVTFGEIVSRIEGVLG